MCRISYNKYIVFQNIVSGTDGTYSNFKPVLFFHNADYLLSTKLFRSTKKPWLIGIAQELNEKYKFGTAIILKQNAKVRQEMRSVTVNRNRFESRELPIVSIRL